LSLGKVDWTWQIYGIADFDGDGKSDILWWNQRRSVANIWLMNGGVRKSLVVPVAPATSPIPPNGNAMITAIGDIDGDGHADILWRDIGTHGLVAWMMRNPAAPTVVDVAGGESLPNNYQVVGTGDFDGNGKADVLWTDGTGYFVVWLLDG